MLLKKKKLKTCSLDPSLTGSAFIMFEDYKMADYYFFTNTKKYKSDEHAIVLPRLDEYKNDIERLIYIKEEIVSRIINFNPDYFAIEGYANKADDSKVYTIGGFIEGIKERLYLQGIKIRIYEPTRIKLFITGNGSAGKPEMAVGCFKKYGIDFVQYGKGISENLVDAYCIGEMLNFELQIRENTKLLDNNPKYVQDCFLKKTKSNPIPLIEREFISK